MPLIIQFIEIQLMMDGWVDESIVEWKFRFEIEINPNCWNPQISLAAKANDRLQIIQLF